MLATEPEMAITFERKPVAKWFQRLSNMFDHARPEYDTADIDRHHPTSETQMPATKQEVETGSGNNV